MPWRKRLEQQKQEQEQPKENRWKRNSFIEKSATEDISKLKRNSSFSNSRSLRENEPEEKEFKKNMDKANAFESILNQQRQKMKNAMNKLEDSKITNIPEVPLMTSASTSNILSIRRESSVISDNQRIDHGKLVLNLRAVLKKESKSQFYYRVLFREENDENFSQITDMFIPKNQKLTTDHNYILKTKKERQYSVRPKFTELETIGSDIVEISSALAKILDVNLYEKILLQSLECVPNFVEKIEIIPPTNVHMQIAKDIEEKFKKYVVKNTRLTPLVLNNNQPLKLGDYTVKILLEPTSLPFCEVNSNFLRDFSIHVPMDKCDKVLAASLLEKVTDSKEKEREVIKFSKYDVVVESTIESIGEILGRKKQFFAISNNYLVSGMYFFKLAFLPLSTTVF